MPRKSVRKSRERKRSIIERRDEFFSQIKWGESYTSLVLGAVVVVVGLILVFSFLRSRSILNQDTTSTSTSNNNQTITPSQTNQTTYTVKEGEHLWKIAEDRFGSGYNWVDIAKANKISNPDVLPAGTKLSIPRVAAKEKTVQAAQQVQPNAPNAIRGNSYTIVQNDHLWDIAIRAYGDGYKWVDIAKANKIANPNIIYPGIKLTLPR